MNEQKTLHCDDDHKLIDLGAEIPRTIIATWPAPGFEDAELGVFMEPEVSHGETEVYPRVQA
jgi:hypothetical protein